MLSVWLIPSFTIDLVNHLAKIKGGILATELAKAGKQLLGVSNSTGLGMAPFLVRHPVLLNNWMMVREEALARVRSLQTANEATLAGFKTALSAAVTNADLWRSEHPLQVEKLTELRANLETLSHHIDSAWEAGSTHPWDSLWRWGEEHLPVEGQEALLALMLEPHGDIIDDLANCVADDGAAHVGIDGSMPISQFKAMVENSNRWALDTKRFDPCSDRWVRISLFQGQPYPQETCTGNG